MASSWTCSNVLIEIWEIGRLRCAKYIQTYFFLSINFRIHTGERPYKCKYCDFAFKQSNDLVRHTRRHTGETPYTCGVCNQRFIQKTVLKQHQLTVGHLEDIPELSSHIEEQGEHNDLTHQN